MAMSLLSVRNVKATYGKVVALDGVSLTVESGELVTLVGANGAGKSTLMKAITGLVHPSAGQIEFDGQSLVDRETYDIVRLGIAYVPEGRGTLRELSVRENLRLGAFARNWNAEARADLDRVLARFPVLAERIDQLAGTLSGGEQQMLVIGRALMSRPRLMLLDEPSLGLAPLMGQRVFDIVRELNTQGVAILLVEQNARAALKLAKRGYVIETGRVVLEGSDLAESQRIREAFLGVDVGGL
jgi:branched-chain amino acid transport system ATP-binding protein